MNSQLYGNGLGFLGQTYLKPLLTSEQHDSKGSLTEFGLFNNSLTDTCTADDNGNTLIPSLVIGKGGEA